MLKWYLTPLFRRRRGQSSMHVRRKLYCKSVKYSKQMPSIRIKSFTINYFDFDVYSTNYGLMILILIIFYIYGSGLVYFGVRVYLSTERSTAMISHVQTTSKQFHVVPNVFFFKKKKSPSMLTWPITTRSPKVCAHPADDFTSTLSQQWCLL